MLSVMNENKQSAVLGQSQMVNPVVASSDLGKLAENPLNTG